MGLHEFLDQEVEEGGEDAAKERAYDGYPAVAPLAGALALYRQYGVSDARPQVTCRIDGITRRAAERHTNHHNKQGHR